MKNSMYEDLLRQKKYAALLELIVKSGNIQELQNALKHNGVVKTLLQASDYFLDQSYKSKNLATAKFLLSYGIDFNIRHFAYMDKSTDKVGDLLKHMYDIKTYLSSEQFDLAFNYIVTFYSNPLSKITDKKCFIAEDVLMSLTHTNDDSKAHLIKENYNNLYLNSTPMMHDILEAIALSNFKYPSLKIFMPFGNSAYLHSIATSDNRIYFPISLLDQKEQLFLMHELTHYASIILKDNEFKPYQNDDIESIKSYHRATKEVLANIIPLFKINKDKVITEQMINDETVTVRNVCSKIDAVLPLHIFGFYGNSNYNNILSRTFLGHGDDSARHKTHFLQHYLDNVIDIYNFDNNAVYVLSRISDLCLRQDNELEYEPIAFAVELEGHGTGDIVKPLVTLLNNDFSIFLKAFREKEEIFDCSLIFNNTSVSESSQPLLTMEIDITGKVMNYTNDTLEIDLH
jgi:hypothetical protein